MANTYTQIFIHIVFGVYQHEHIICKNYKEEIHKYIAGIILNKKQKLLAINCMPDHIHIFIGMKSNICLSDLIRDIKHFSSNFINEKKWITGKFYWQKGYGAFSYSYSHIDVVIDYIKNQETHHINKTFQVEYMDLLKKFHIDYDEKYLFD